MLILNLFLEQKHQTAVEEGEEGKAAGAGES